MKPSALMLMLMFLWSPWGSAAAADGRVVGIVTLEMGDRAGLRNITSELWFQAAREAITEEFSPRPPFRALTIARQAAIDPASAKRPLIVISHGNFGTRFSHGWLAVRLVNAGYVVLSTSHPGTMAGDQSVTGRYRLWDRSGDVSFAIDRVLSDPRWSRAVDGARIGFVGHSFGGWTGVSLAGGRYDPARQRAWCEQAPKKDFYCAGTLKDDIAGVPTTHATESFRDRRVRAFYIMAAGPGQGFTRESLASIEAPFVVETAKLDEVLEPSANSSELARKIPGAREVVRLVGHFAYAPECIGTIPAPLSQICTDPPGVDRATIHRQVAQDVINFFNDTLRR